MKKEANYTCKICGKKYYANRGFYLGTPNAWRLVACSKEHYEQYLRQVEESRNPKKEKEEKVLAESKAKSVSFKEKSLPTKKEDKKEA